MMDIHGPRARVPRARLGSAISSYATRPFISSRLCISLTTQGLPTHPGVKSNSRVPAEQTWAAASASQ